MSRKRTLIAIILIVAFALSSLFLPLHSAEGTRAGETYSVMVDGSEVDDDGSVILLAGYGWYAVRMNFTDIAIGDIGWINMSLVEREAPQDTLNLFSFNTGTSELNNKFYDAQAEVRIMQISNITASRFTLSFDIFFHLNWSYNDRLNFKPSLDGSDGLTIRPTVESVLTLQVFGSLSTPVLGEVTDSLDRPINENDIVRSNSTLHFTGIKLYYNHPNPEVNLSGLFPSFSEVQLQMVIGDSSWNATHESGSFSAEVVVPRMDSGTVDIGMKISNIPASSTKKVDLWSFSVKVDGLGPSFLLKKPIERSPTALVNWTVEVQEVPIEHHIMVDGSSVEYQYKNADGNWSIWLPVNDVEDNLTISVSGTTTCILGDSTTRIRLRANDALGNVGTSGEISIHVNMPPVVTIPDELMGRSYLQNETLSLTGADLVQDQDDLNLIFTYIFDGEEYTGEDLKKSLFSIPPGDYTVTVLARDPWGSTGSASFDITVIEVEEEVDEKTLLEEIMEPPMFYLLSFVLLVILIIIIVVVILVISKKVRESNRDDFIMDEDLGLDDGSAAEIARRLQEMYVQQNYSTAPAIDKDSAISDDDDEEFSFNYNLYSVLSLEPSSEAKEIKRSYRKLAAYYHPDRVSLDDSIDSEDAMEMMVMVNKAKEILLNPEKKARYDSYISDLDFEFDMESE